MLPAKIPVLLVALLALPFALGYRTALGPGTHARITTIAHAVPAASPLHAPTAAAKPESEEAYYLRQTMYGTWTVAPATVLLAVGTLFFMRRQVAEAKRSAQLQIFIQVTDRFDGDSLLKARSEVAKAVLIDATPSDSCAQAVLDQLEHVGYLTREGHLDRRMVYNQFVNHVCCYWGALHEYAHSVRAKLHQNDVYEHVEWLAKTLGEIEKSKHGGAPTETSFSAEVIAEFMRAEINPQLRAERRALQ